MTDDQMDQALRKSTELLIKNVGLKRASEVSGKAVPTLSKYYSQNADDPYAPINVIAKIEREANFPAVTNSMAEMCGLIVSYKHDKPDVSGNINTDVIKLSERFAKLMMEYQISIEDGIITLNEAKRLIKETTSIQQVLLEMKQHLEMQSNQS